MQGIHTPALRVVSWNPNTLGKDDSLTWLFGSLHGHSPNIICIQETHLTAEMAKYFTVTGFQIIESPASSTNPRKGEDRGLLTAVSLDLLVDPNHPKTALDMGPDTETLSVRVNTSEGWYTINNVYTHQGAKPANLVLNPSPSKCITVGDLNSRHKDWEPLDRAPPTDTGMGNKLHSLIQSNPSITLANIPRVATTESDTTLTLSLVSPDIIPATDWEVLQDCSSWPHFATLYFRVQYTSLLNCIICHHISL